MFLLLDKPKWRTSFDCIRKLQRLYGKKIYDKKVKIWHAGTLDPMATGLMIMALWKSTKQLWSLIGLDKVYTATIDLSQMTDTWDADPCERSEKIDYRVENAECRKGSDVHKKRWYHLGDKKIIPTKEDIEKVLESFTHRREFLLTPFSAKKIEGKKLYEYARAWNPILKSSAMQVIKAKLIEYTFPLVKVRFEVWSWTYIRSLGFELGKALGWWGILTELRRESVGTYSL